MKQILSSAIYLLLFFNSPAQVNKLTLQQTVEIAHENNLLVKQYELQSQREAVNLKQARASILPDLGAGLNNGSNQGRSIDPFTNSYINQQVNTADFNLSSGIALYNGGRIHHTVKQNELGYKASKMELQQVKDRLTLDVIVAYVQILNNEDQLKQARKQEQLSRLQVERLAILNKEGAISPADLYDLRGQLSNDLLSIINIQNTLNTARLNLAQLMNVPFNKNLEVEPISANEFVAYETSPDQIYQQAMKNLALVKGTALRRQSAEKGVRVAKSLYYPAVSLSGVLFTNFSSAARKSVLLNTSQVMSGDYVEVAGSKVPVYKSQGIYNAEKINYFNQFNNNYRTSVSLGLSIPIFSAFRAKYNVALAKIQLKNSMYVEETTNTQLRQSIEEAYFNMTAAYARYNTLVQQVADYSELFRTAEVKFNAGVTNQVDYLIAKNKLDMANTNYIIAKYDYLARIKVLDYYQGKPLW